MEREDGTRPGREMGEEAPRDSQKSLAKTTIIFQGSPHAEMIINITKEIITSVCATVVAAHEVSILGEQVDELALALIAPLATDDRHNLLVHCHTNKQEGVTLPMLNTRIERLRAGQLPFSQVSDFRRSMSARNLTPRARRRP